MTASYSISIKTPQKTIFEGSIESLVAPGTEGYLGVLANHAPFIATLTAGRITCRESGGATKVFESTGSGLLEVLNNFATLLLDSVNQS